MAERKGEAVNVQLRSVAAFEVQVGDLYLGICHSKEQAWDKLDVRDEGGSRESMEGYVEARETIGAIDALPLTMRAFRFGKDAAGMMSGYLYGFYGERDRLPCYSQEAALHRLMVEFARSAGFDDENDYGEWPAVAPNDLQVAAYRAVVDHVTAQIRASGLPSSRTQQDLALRQHERSAREQWLGQFLRTIGVEPADFGIVLPDPKKKLMM